jgi:hypothetical protein
MPVFSSILFPLYFMPQLKRKKKQISIVMIKIGLFYALSLIKNMENSFFTVYFKLPT